MPKREAHCAYFIDNGGGKCVAHCHHNLPRYLDLPDCTGSTGTSWSDPNRREKYVSCGFIDGRNVEVDGKGYPVVRPTVSEPETKAPDDATGDVAYGWGTYIQPDGRIYKFATTPNGIPYKSYITQGRP